VKDIKYIKSLSARAVARKSAAIKVHEHYCVFIADCAVQQYSALFILVNSHLFCPFRCHSILYSTHLHTRPYIHLFQCPYLCPYPHQCP
jgi:hypothetical protein